MSLVFLIGCRGAGKSVVARLLAARIGWDWCDADQLLETRLNTTIKDILAHQGETAFRAGESQVLAEICLRNHLVVATGGGVVLRPENHARLRSGKTVWLTADAPTLWSRIRHDAATSSQRPDLAQGGLEEVEETLRLRAPLYAACADLQVETAERTPDEVVEQIAAWLGTS